MSRSGKPNERVQIGTPNDEARHHRFVQKLSADSRDGHRAIVLDKATPVTSRAAAFWPEAGAARRYEVIHRRRRFRELSRGVRIFVTAELSKRRLNETESERGALRAARMLDEPLMRAPRDDDAVVRSRSIYRCAHRRYPSAAPVASFLPHFVVDTPDLVSQNTQRRRRGVRRASPAQGLERKAQEPRKPRLRGHR